MTVPSSLYTSHKYMTSAIPEQASMMSTCSLRIVSPVFQSDHMYAVKSTAKFQVENQTSFFITIAFKISITLKEALHI